MCCGPSHVPGRWGVPLDAMHLAHPSPHPVLHTQAIAFLKCAWHMEIAPLSKKRFGCVCCHRPSSSGYVIKSDNIISQNMITFHSPPNGLRVSRAASIDWEHGRAESNFQKSSDLGAA